MSRTKVRTADGVSRRLQQGHRARAGATGRRGWVGGPARGCRRDRPVPLAGAHHVSGPPERPRSAAAATTLRPADATVQARRMVQPTVDVCADLGRTGRIGAPLRPRAGVQREVGDRRRRAARAGRGRPSRPSRSTRRPAVRRRSARAARPAGRNRPSASRLSCHGALRAPGMWPGPRVDRRVAVRRSARRCARRAACASTAGELVGGDGTGRAGHGTRRAVDRRRRRAPSVVSSPGQAASPPSSTATGSPSTCSSHHSRAAIEPPASS